MPILPAEPDSYPENVLTAGPDYDPAAVPWWAAYVLARREKDLMRRLRKLNVPFYCPLVKKRQKSPGGRIRISQVPLFSGYVFLRGTEEQRYQALTTNCVSRCLAVPDSINLVHDLLQIQRLIAADRPLLPESKLEAGMPVRIRSGALLGLEGVVIKRRGEERILVAVRFLQQGASVLLEDFEVERI